MVVETTGKVAYLSRPTVEEFVVWAQSFVPSVDHAQFQLSDAELFNIIANEHVDMLFRFFKTQKWSSEMLEALISYKYVKTDDVNVDDPQFGVLSFVLKNENCTSQIIEHIYEACVEDEDILSSIAMNTKTPAHILIELLPNATTFEFNAGVFNFNKSTQVLNAMMNPSTPIFDAMFASQWADKQDYINVLWLLRYVEFQNYMLTVKNVDISDYPSEWVQELVWTGGVK